jgi:hypothetical protein
MSTCMVFGNFFWVMSLGLFRKRGGMGIAVRVNSGQVPVLVNGVCRVAASAGTAGESARKAKVAKVVAVVNAEKMGLLI